MSENIYQQHWDHYARATKRSGDFLNRHPDICFHLRYETYSEGPTALKPLFKFLDEPFDAERVTSILAQKLTHAKPRALEGTGDPYKPGFAG